MTPLLWDQHACLPLPLDADISELTRYQRPSGAFVSVNAGYAPHSFADASALLNHFRHAIDAHPDLVLAGAAEDVPTIAHSGRIAVAFDLEDSRPLEGDLDNVPVFVDLGVRTMLPTRGYGARRLALQRPHRP